LISLRFVPPQSPRAVNKVDLLDQLRTERLIGLVSADYGERLIDCARALSEGNIHFLEIALTTPGILATLQTAAAALPDFRFGLGTVLDVDTARRGILAGASFIVTPAPRPEVITLCRRYHVPVISGAFTRANLECAHQAGADAVKVFPGEQFGPAYINALRRDYPAVPLIPIGGVTSSTIAEFIRAGATATIAGNSLITETDMVERNWPAITIRAGQFAQAIASAVVSSS